MNMQELAKTHEAQLMALLEVVKNVGKETTLSAFTVAEYIMSSDMLKALKRQEMTRTKVQKLLYYIQGYHLLVHGKPLFKEDFQAHATGFIVPSLYEALGKEYEYRSIPKKPFTYRGTDFTEATVLFIHRVLDMWGDLDGKTMEELIHQGMLWLEVPEGEFITKADLLHQFEQEHEGEIV